MSDFKVVSLFSGCGGSSLGYRMAGGQVVLAVEWDENAQQTYRINNISTPIFPDVTKLSVDETLRLTGLKPGELDVLDGSPPCQGFSRSGRRNLDDPRNQMFREYVRLLDGLKPKAFVMENVPGLAQGKMRLIFRDILIALKGCGYRVACRILDAAAYGTPQHRTRTIFIGVRDDLNIEPTHPAPTASNHVRVIDAIGHLTDTGGDPLPPSIARFWPRLKFGESPKLYHPRGHYFNFAKLHPFRPSFTITKSSVLMHWQHPRFLNSQELIALAGFPTDYQWAGTPTDIRERIGNCVPPPFMRAIAAHIKATILEAAICN